MTTLRFGVSSDPSDLPLARRLDALCASLSDLLGQPVSGEVAAGYQALADALCARQLALAWLPPVTALRALRQAPLTAIASPVREGTSSYSTVLVARSGSPFQSAASLQGARAGWVDPESAAGCAVIRARLLEDGLDPQTLFAEQRYLGSHPRVIKALLDGEIDVGATYAHVNRDGTLVSASWDAAAGRDALRVLLLEGPIPADLLVASAALSAEQIATIEQALCDPSTPTARAARAMIEADSFARPSGPQVAALARLLARLDDLAP